MIESLDIEGNVKLRMDPCNEKLSFNLEKMSHIEYGYVTTSYSSQAMTAPQGDCSHGQGFVGASAFESRVRFVAWSRGQHEAALYTNDREDLDRVLLRSDEKAMALAPNEVAKYQAKAAIGR